MRFLDEALGVADDAGDEPRDGLDHRHGGDLSPVEHVVAEAHRAHPAARGVVVDDALVDALVASAGEDEVRLLGELAREGLGEALAGRRGHDEHRILRQHLVERRAPRLGLHDHAGAAAVGRVVHGAVAVVRPVAEVVHPQIQDAALARLADERDVEHIEEGGEDRHDVDAHGSKSRHPAMFRVCDQALTRARPQRVTHP